MGEERGEVDESTRMDTERMLTVYIRITDVDRACCPKGVIEHLASRHGRWECEREEVGEGANEKSRTNRSSTSASSFLLLSLSPLQAAVLIASDLSLWSVCLVRPSALQGEAEGF